MASNQDLEAKYQRALQRLSELVLQRDRCLLQLDTLASLPLSISPRAGHVAEFDMNAARELLNDVQRQSHMIEIAVDAVNEAAQAAGHQQVVWLKMPRSHRGEQG